MKVMSTLCGWIEFPLAESTFDGAIRGGWGRFVRQFVFVAWHVCGSLEGRSQTETLVFKGRYALISRRQNQPDEMLLSFGHATQEKSYCSAQLSTFFKRKPFDEYVEGLSYCGD